MTAEPVYWLERQGAVRGPYSFEILLTMWTRKELQLTDRIRADGAESWREVSQLIEVLERAERANPKTKKNHSATVGAIITTIGAVLLILATVRFNSVESKVLRRFADNDNLFITIIRQPMAGLGIDPGGDTQFLTTIIIGVVALLVGISFLYDARRSK